MPTVLLMSPLINRFSHQKASLMSGFFDKDFAGKYEPINGDLSAAAPSKKPDKLSAREEAFFLDSVTRQIARQLRAQNLVPDLILTSPSPDAKDTGNILQAELSRQVGWKIPFKIDASILMERKIESGLSSVESLLGAIASLDNDAPDMYATRRALAISKMVRLAPGETLNIFDFADSINGSPNRPQNGAAPTIALVIVGETLAKKSLWALATPEATKEVIKRYISQQIIVVRGKESWRKLATSRAKSLEQITFG